MTNPNEDLLSMLRRHFHGRAAVPPVEAAKALGIAATTIRNAIASGRLPVVDFDSGKTPPGGPAKRLIDLTEKGSA